MGVAVERPTELLGYRRRRRAVVARLRAADGRGRRARRPTSPAATARARSCAQTWARLSRAAPIARCSMWPTSRRRARDQRRPPRRSGRGRFPGGLSAAGKGRVAPDRHGARRARGPRRDATFEDVSGRAIENLKIKIEQGQLVLDLPRAPPRGGAFPQGTRVPAGRRGAHPQPGRRPGHEHRHRRRDQPGLEARGRAGGRAPDSCWTATRPSASPSPASWWRPPTGCSASPPPRAGWPTSSAPGSLPLVMPTGPGRGRCGESCSAPYRNS